MRFMRRRSAYMPTRLWTTTAALLLALRLGALARLDDLLLLDQKGANNPTADALEAARAAVGPRNGALALLEPTHHRGTDLRDARELVAAVSAAGTLALLRRVLKRELATRCLDDLHRVGLGVVATTPLVGEPAKRRIGSACVARAEHVAPLSSPNRAKKTQSARYGREPAGDRVQVRAKPRIRLKRRTPRTSEPWCPNAARCASLPERRRRQIYLNRSIFAAFFFSASEDSGPKGRRPESGVEGAHGAARCTLTRAGRERVRSHL